MRARGFTLIELMLIVAIIAIIAAIAVPALLAAQRIGYERNASTSMRNLVIAEADFRGNDRDGDRTQNFWTRDVYGLHGLCPSTDGFTAPTPMTERMIKLVDGAIGGADATGVAIVSGCVPISSAVGTYTPKASYVYRAFANYEVSSGTTAPMSNAGHGAIGAYGASWNITRYGFMAVPLDYSTGRRVFIAGETGTIWQATLGADYFASYVGGTATSATITLQTCSVAGVAFNENSAFPMTPGAVGYGKID